MDGHILYEFASVIYWQNNAAEQIAPNITDLKQLASICLKGLQVSERGWAWLGGGSSVSVGHMRLGAAGCWLADLGWPRLALQAELSLCHMSRLQLAGTVHVKTGAGGVTEGCQAPKA